MSILKESEYNFCAGEVGFDCPCGGLDDFVLCAGGDTKTCEECGRVFTLIHRVEIDRPNQDFGEYLKESIKSIEELIEYRRKRGLMTMGGSR